MSLHRWIAACVLFACLVSVSPGARPREAPYPLVDHVVFSISGKFVSTTETDDFNVNVYNNSDGAYRWIKLLNRNNTVKDEKGFECGTGIALYDGTNYNTTTSPAIWDADAYTGSVGTFVDSFEVGDQPGGVVWQPPVSGAMHCALESGSIHQEYGTYCKWSGDDIHFRVAGAMRSGLADGWCSLYIWNYDRGGYDHYSTLPIGNMERAEYLWTTIDQPISGALYGAGSTLWLRLEIGREEDGDWVIYNAHEKSFGITNP